jgi:hypothetical protein
MAIPARRACLCVPEIWFVGSDQPPDPAINAARSYPGIITGPTLFETVMKLIPKLSPEERAQVHQATYRSQVITPPCPEQVPVVCWLKL